MAGRKSRAQIMANETKQSSMAFTDTPEFKTAVVAEVQRALKDARELASTSANSVDDNFAERLALAIASLNQQMPGAKKFVAPEVVQARKEAREKMTQRIIAARAANQAPRYALKNKVYLDEQIVDPFWIGVDRQQHQTEIEWPGVPSEAMIPLNDVAKDIYALFQESIGTKTDFLDDRPLRMTAGGLVVHGAPRPTRQTGVRMGGDGKEEGGQGLRVAHRDGGRMLNVLGTVAPPARENSIYPEQRGAR